MPEYSLYKDLLFEIQVRTVLQHAWAEIEHDRNYKFSGVLPTHLQRRLHLLAGVLEVVDREFVTLAKDIDSYAQAVSEKTQSGDLEVEITTVSVTQYFLREEERLEGISPRPEQNYDETIEELRDFGLRTLADLDGLFTDEFIGAQKEHPGSDPITGLLRNAMMYSDLDRYFASAWKLRWASIDMPAYTLLKEKYGQEKVDRVLQDRKIGVDPDL